MKHERNPVAALAALLLIGLTAGCVAVVPPAPALHTPPDAIAPAPPGAGWWFVQFRMNRPAEGPRWAMDALIAHRVVAPIRSAHDRAIPLWRFHRRSGNDEDGHRFSFIFFSDAATADRINRAVLADRLLPQLIGDGLVRDVRVDAVEHNDRPGVEDTSDRSWSPVMQAAWPHYIMGVSRMWLEMIDRISRDIGLPDDPATDSLLGHYEAVNGEVTRIWQQEGYHALLHHLNAIYGYEALVYWEKRWKAF